MCSRWLVLDDANRALLVFVWVRAWVQLQLGDGQRPSFFVRQLIALDSMPTAESLPGLHRIHENGRADHCPCIYAATAPKEVRPGLQSLSAYLHRLLPQEDPAEPFVSEHEYSCR